MLPNLRPLSQTPVSDPCLRPLSQTPVSDPCLIPLSQSPVSDPCPRPLSQTPVSDPCPRPQSQTPVSDPCLRPLSCVRLRCSTLDELNTRNMLHYKWKLYYLVSTAMIHFTMRTTLKSTGTASRDVVSKIGPTLHPGKRNFNTV